MIYPEDFMNFPKHCHSYIRGLFPRHPKYPQKYIHEVLEEKDKVKTITFPFFEDALLEICPKTKRAIYDVEKMEKIIVRRMKLKKDAASDYLEENVLNLSIGQYTPIFLHNRDLHFEEVLMDAHMRASWGEDPIGHKG